MTVTFEIKPMTKVLIYGGKTGWIGGLMNDLCKEKGMYSRKKIIIGNIYLFPMVTNIDVSCFSSIHTYISSKKKSVL